MTMIDTMHHTPDTGLELKVNGSLLAVGRRPKLSELEPALRSVALSDSPVLIRAEPQDASWMIERLHQMGRRAQLPCRSCHTDAEACALFEAIVEANDVSDDSLGTWALFNVHWWAEDKQRRLFDVLGVLDENRLHGRLRHERIPRVVVTVSPDLKKTKLLPELEQRLSYFKLSATNTRPHGEN